MSHAVNLRKASHPSFPESSAKRRKISAVGSSYPSKTNGENALVNGNTGKTFTAIPTQNAKVTPRARNESSIVVVAPGDEPSDVHMTDFEEPKIRATEQDDADSASELGEEEDLPNGPRTEPSNNTMTTLGAGDVADGKGPSFGELLRDRNLEVIDVDASNAEPGVPDKDLIPNSSSRTLTVPTATSLGTVLTQALKTNDVDLLESCLQVPSLESIRATVQRLHSSLATSLLQRLAERLHKRPGRAGSLMVWVQWTIVAHGGYLATQPAAMKQVHALYQVVKQRAAGLQPLLSLKGRLDMLEAQMQMRRNLRQASRTGVLGDANGPAVIYVEGEEEAEIVKAVEDITNQTQASIQDNLLSTGADSDEEEGDWAPTLTNGVGFSDEEVDMASSSDDEHEDLLDDEAEESENDSESLSAEVDIDDGEEDDDQDEDGLESEVEERPLNRSADVHRDSSRRKQRS